MSVDRFRARSPIAATADALYRWHLSDGAFERLRPPWERIAPPDPAGPIFEGKRVRLRLRAGPFPVQWIAEHRDFVAGRGFSDIQLRGPFRHWTHRHRFEPRESGATLADEVDYALPLGGLGRLGAGGSLRRKLCRVFAYRHALTAGDLERHRGRRALSVAVSGSGGLVGSALVAFLRAGGHRVVRLVRRAPRAADEVGYDAEAGSVQADALEGLDALVHLAGESIAAGRWTERRKRSIRESRVAGTRLLAETLAGLARPPAVWINASAIGFYGDRADEELDEASTSGEGFLAATCREWEGAVEPAAQAGIRVVRLRIGVVLAAAGGALPRMLTPFRLGLGGRLGDGRQFMSWIALDDLVGLIHFLLRDDGPSGAVNAVAPEPVRNLDFTRRLGRVLRRPVLLPLPAAAIRLMLGEMGEALLLAGARVLPRRALEAGFRFRHADLGAALRFELGLLDAADGLPEFEKARS